MAGLADLRSNLSRLGRVVVAFSGGADSALLAWVANDTLGSERAVCVTAVSESLAPEERVDASRLAEEWGLSWQEVETAELDDPQYAANGPDRCYHCKAELMSVLTPLARAMKATVVLGVNVDDLGEHRPGQEAAADAGARFPLVEAGITKDEVRKLSRELGLRTWDKPAAACLASRLPYGTTVTVSVLGRVARAESGLRRLGFRHLRVRHYGDVARVELGPDEMDRAMSLRGAVVEAVRSAGYDYVTLDLEGLRSGNLNRALAGPATFAFVPDLMDRSRLSGVPGVRFVGSAGELAELASPHDLVIVDLSRPGSLDALESVTASRVVGFASHVDDELMGEARRRGCDEVLARSVFFRRYSAKGRGGEPTPGRS